MYYKKDNARFLKVPILFSQHEHRTLTGQKLYFKRVLPLFSRPYLIFRQKVPEFSPQSLLARALFEGKKVQKPYPKRFLYLFSQPQL
jgi:hypothetical protein